ncbi:hypothetical protein GCM10011401_01300 [Nesterenkonia cremea]|uniref:Uncharacterized protein n=1 Tax=Nesterenkonia cremea TaxID=1882340 RepID=A0A917AKL8_9MICC|nr:hypothetical protein GCM10011401_01300 [Nesterenkonia cremea]
MVGGLSLIPARKYPGWIRQGLTWGSTGLVMAVALSPGATSGLLKALGAKYGDAEQRKGAERQEEASQRQQQSEQGESASSGSSAGAREDAECPQVSWMSRTAAALVVGGFAYGTWRFAWWADDAAERALQRMRVPAPRVVMAAAAAALTYREARQDQEARSQVQGQLAQHRTQG